MRVNLKKVIVLYKRSAYEVYFLERQRSLFKKHRRFDTKEISNFKKAHITHYQTLKGVLEFLKERGIKFKKCTRGRKVNLERYDLIITVGGDGTFLEAARRLKRQIILGVNSDPERSIGRFCGADKSTFKKVLADIMKGKAKIRPLNRIKLTLQKPFRSVNPVRELFSNGVNVLNDILVCHENPAAMTRYYISINGVREEHRNSGLWISTAAGSSGAIRSAGGKVMAQNDKRIQYMQREMQYYKGIKNKLKSGIVRLRKPVTIKSLKHRCVVYVDGAHARFPFDFGDVIRISSPGEPLRVVCR